MSQTEAEVLAKARLALNQMPGKRVFRNNVGKLKDARGRWVEFGLCVGSSDLIGFESFVIGPEHVGQTVARFLAVECKTHDGRVTPEQQAFIDLVNSFGGKAVVLRGSKA